MKFCISCSVEQPLENFWRSRNGRTRDGYKNECKECAKARRRAWGAANRTRVAHYNRESYQNDPERFIASSRAWDAAHPMKRREIRRTSEGARRARKRAAFIEHVEPSVVYEMHGGRCGICGGFVSRSMFHVDHILPLAKGGAHGYINVQPAHPQCNLSKGARC